MDIRVYDLYVNYVSEVSEAYFHSRFILIGRLIFLIGNFILKECLTHKRKDKHLIGEPWEFQVKHFHHAAYCCLGLKCLASHTQKHTAPCLSFFSL